MSAANKFMDINEMRNTNPYGDDNTDIKCPPTPLPPPVVAETGKFEQGITRGANDDQNGRRLRCRSKKPRDHMFCSGARSRVQYLSSGVDTDVCNFESSRGGGF